MMDFTCDVLINQIFMCRRSDAADARHHGLYCISPTAVGRIIAGSVAALSVLVAVATIAVSRFSVSCGARNVEISILSGIFIFEAQWLYGGQPRCECHGMLTYAALLHQIMVRKTSAANAPVSLFQLPRAMPSQMELHHMSDMVTHAKAYVTSLVSSSTPAHKV